MQYRLIHSDARLSDNERQRLEAGLVATWAKDPPGPSSSVAATRAGQSGHTRTDSVGVRRELRSRFVTIAPHGGFARGRAGESARIDAKGCLPGSTFVPKATMFERADEGR